MAVPFHVPDAANPATSSSPSTAPSSAVVTSTSGSVPQTPQPQNPSGGIAQQQHSPLLAPLNSEHLVQAFCEALYRYSRVQGGSPGYSMTTPPSPSSCNGSDVFFNFNDLRNPQTDDYYGSPRTPYRRVRSNSFPMPSTRVRLSSQGHEMTDDEDDSTDENFTQPTNLLNEHFNFMAARENMQEFPGRVPRKRKRESGTTQQDSNKPKEQKFAWPLFALGVLAVGCGLLASR